MMISEYLPVKKPNRKSNNRDERKLAQALHNYTHRGSSYDAEFDVEIRTIQPGWFTDWKERKSLQSSRHERSSRRERLLALAAAGAPRPSSTSNDIIERRLGQSFNNYVNNGPGRDEQFANKIRKLAPGWFKDSVLIKKHKLIELAKSGKPRPKQKRASHDESVLASALCLYCSKNSKSNYDPVFKAEISSLAPSWFSKRITPDEYKVQLLQLAESGADKPIPSTNKKLSHELHKFTNHKSEHYDAVFIDKLRKISPLWLETKDEKQRKIKDKLLEMVRAGVDRPNVTAKDPIEYRLYWSLRRFTDSKSPQYDAEFTEGVRDWFWYRELGINNRPDHYKGLNKYRDYLLEVLRYYDLTRFSANREFWTLGGREWHEHKHLIDGGIKFGPNSYNNVDRSVLNKPIPSGAHAYPDTEFLHIQQLWHKPSVISYDSIICLADSNTRFWQDLCILVIDAAGRSGQVLFVWNFIIAPNSILENETYKRWMQLLISTAESSGLNAEFYDEVVRKPQKIRKSLTKMFTGCCRLSIKTVTTEKQKQKAREKLLNQICEVLTKYPTLNIDGFGDERTKNDTDMLINSADDIKFIAKLLADVRKTHKINSFCEPSLALKSLVEPYSPNKSISHGAFIIGAMVAGFNARIFNNGPSAQFDFSPKALRGKISAMQENWLYTNNINKMQALSLVGPYNGVTK
jgi:hypothetical protein